MFNSHATSELNLFSEFFVDIVRNCEFAAIGKIPTRLNNRVVPLGGIQFIPQLLKHIDGIVGVITTSDCIDKVPQNLGCAIADKPLETAYKVHKVLLEKGRFWTPFQTVVHENASVHPTAYIDSQNVVIGAGTIIAPGARILERTIIGENCFIGPGTIIGTPAYEVGSIDNVSQILPQAGGVRIGNNVSFLGNVMVARSIFPLFTEIGDNCSFDNLVHIGHDCVLGSGVKVTACSMLSGRVTLGNNVYIGPNATISNGITIAANAVVTLGSVVIQDVLEGERVSGNFAMSHWKFMKAYSRARRDS